MNYIVRNAVLEDLEGILAIYSGARSFMAGHGNPTQWGNTYPAEELLRDDIAGKNLYVICEGDSIHGVFAYFTGEDPTYSYIEDGNWLSAEPYGTIHRIAGDGNGGIVKTALIFAQEQNPHVRIDTHHDNTVMQKAVEKLGFIRCGIIFQPDGSTRIAYEKMA